MLELIMGNKLKLLGLSLGGLLVSSPGMAAIANFDSLSQGTSGSTITDNGIIFSDLVAGFRIDQPEFIVQSAWELPSGNYLTMNGAIEGVNPVFGAFGSMSISTGSQSSQASLDVFTTESIDQPDSEIVLDAYLDGRVVARRSASFSQFDSVDGILQRNFSISGVVFDSLFLYTPQAFADGVVYLGVDNVNIDADINRPQPYNDVPEPITLLGTTLVGSLLMLSGKRK